MYLIDGYFAKGEKKNMVPAMRFKMKAQELFKSTKKRYKHIFLQSTP